ncbi:hypothetical protein D1BOALGB6SA_9871 [Olavius sp. associated proteobacterium Delta 1]|nr:hypothetical protein D1BOALGB6SA_9871 [Olavius sp. associated proteobacterium Delta 1]
MRMIFNGSLNSLSDSEEYWATQSRAGKLSTAKKRLLIYSIVFVFALGFILSFFRDVKGDEAYYLLETSIMAECLRAGTWFGNEAVGLHGFLFKLPAAFLFLIFGQSVFVATLVSVVIATVSFWLCFKLFWKLIGSFEWALAGAFLVASNYFFIWSMPRFHREMPAILAVLLLIYAIISRHNKWVLGLILLFVLDAKEYIFFCLVPALFVWITLDEWQQRPTSTLSNISLKIILRCFAAVLPSVVYIILMLFTGLIPLNMFIPSIIGLIEYGERSYAINQFRPETMKIYNSLSGISSFINLHMLPVEGYPENLIGYIKFSGIYLLNGFIWIANQAQPYIGKIFSYRTFSLVGIPKIIALPSLAMSLIMFGRWSRTRRIEYLFLPLAYWVYLLIFFLHVSKGRHLFPIVPLIVLFFLYFIKDGLKENRLSAWVLLWTSLFIAMGFVYDPKSLLIKIFLNAIILAVMVTALRGISKKWKYAYSIAVSIPALLIFISTMVAMASSLGSRGQIGNYQELGYNRECKKIIDEFDPEERVWVNSNISLSMFYRKERSQTPEWHWTLKPIVPKKAILNRYPYIRTLGFSWQNIDDFREKLREFRVAKVGLVVSDNLEYSFYRQDQLEDLKKSSWLRFDRSVPLKNKELYIFQVVDGVLPASN